MAVSSKHILSQLPVLAALGRTSFAALWQRLDKRPRPEIRVPGPLISAELPPRPRALVRDYVRNVGGDPARYRRVLPPHLFPQWSFPLVSQTLQGVSYPLIKVVNGGCRIDVHAPLPADEPLQVSAQLVSVEDNGQRAVLQQRIITGTASVPSAQTAMLYAIVPLAPKREGPKRARPCVPSSAREIAFWQLSSSAGLDFAKLTGDFNPIHWVPAWARAFGFKNTILHGFGTLARAFEGLQQNLLKHRFDLQSIDVKFTRPLVLPARVGLYVDDGDQIFVGDAPGGPAYMTGTFRRNTL